MNARMDVWHRNAATIRMKLATYNINGINGRLPVLLRWLQQSKPDVVCLQELKAQQDNFPLAAIESAGYGAIWHGQKSWNGVAILTRGQQPFETRRRLPAQAHAGFRWISLSPPIGSHAERRPTQMGSLPTFQS